MRRKSQLYRTRHPETYERNRAYMAARRRQLRAAGRCVHCAEPNDRTGALCERCAQRQRERRIERREKRELEEHFPNMIPSFILVIDLASISGDDPAGVTVQIEMQDPRLVYPTGDPPQTIFPTQLSAVTNSQGMATVKLVPSSVVGRYKVSVGSFTRVIEMPAANARLSALMAA